MSKALSGVLVLCAAALASGACASKPRAAQGAPRAETPAQRDARMAPWRDARFGMFIHWGLYSIPAGQWNGKRVPGTGEWIQTNAPIQVRDYEPLRDRFNPVMFDAWSWARAARRAGMKYVVITTKHHDGFCLFDSQLTDWDVMSSPFKRDIMREIARACRDEGLMVGWYHSIMDWHHPDYLPRRKWEERPAEGADFDRFRAYLTGQVSELLTNYGPIDVMWFDGEWEDTWTHEHGVELANTCRSLQPRVIINNRVDKGRNDMAGLDKAGDWAGDFGTPEQEVPSTGIPGVDWESCMTMNDTWGFRSDDHNWKSSTDLIRTLCDVASKGGNFLLNVGPTADGLIPEASLQRMADIGRWMDVNAEAIYSTHASPFTRLPWGRATVRGNDLYLHVFDWPTDGRLVLPGLLTDVRAAAVLGGPILPQSAVRREGEDVAITVPASGVHQAATVVKLSLVAPPAVSARANQPPPPHVGVPDADGAITLLPEHAALSGPSIRVERKGPNIGFWTDKGGVASWQVSAPPGEYSLAAEVACTPDRAGSLAVFAVGDRSLSIPVPDTGDWTSWKSIDVGRIVLSSQPATLEVRCGEPFTGALMNLRAITLRPVK